MSECPLVAKLLWQSLEQSITMSMGKTMNEKLLKEWYPAKPDVFGLNVIPLDY